MGDGVPAGDGILSTTDGLALFGMGPEGTCFLVALGVNFTTGGGVVDALAAAVARAASRAAILD